jgi:hypothetical protein
MVGPEEGFSELDDDAAFRNATTVQTFTDEQVIVIRFPCEFPGSRTLQRSNVPGLEAGLSLDGRKSFDMDA